MQFKCQCRYNGMRKMSATLKLAFGGLLLAALPSFIAAFSNEVFADPNYVLIIANGNQAQVKMITRTNQTDGREKLNNANGDFKVTFGTDLGNASDCTVSGTLLCIQSGDQTTRMTINNRANFASTNKSQLFNVKITGDGESIQACFDHGGHNLYGGAVQDNYPSQNIKMEDNPFVTGIGLTGPVAERIWYTSTGRAIRVPRDVPLFVTQDDRKLCLTAKNQSPYSEDTDVFLEVDMCLTSNVKEAWLCFNPKSNKPTPPDYMIQKPIWSTWVAYKTLIDQAKTIEFAGLIKNGGYEYGILEIDDNWETCYGSQEFDTEKFSDAKKMVDDLHNDGFKVTLWRHPFINVECKSVVSEWKDHLMKYEDGTLGTTHWWNGWARLIDFTNQATCDYFYNKLHEFQTKYGFDGFKFDAGEASYIPALEAERQLTNPNIYTTNYINTVAKFGTNTEARSGADNYKTQMFQRLQDTNSDWLLSNHGLPSVIPSMLELTILGYGAIMPDMIGGNAYKEAVDNEMFIRWVQLNTFMPIMQFSSPPWELNSVTQEVTKKCIGLHAEYADYILELFNSTEPMPVNPPIWWIDPTDTTAQKVMDEYLLGDLLLVAPVVKKGATTRDIYFPKGTWINVETKEVITGPKWMRKYPADLETLPYFCNQNNARCKQT